MAQSGISVSRVADEINKALKAYTDEVEVTLERVKKDVAKGTVSELKRTSPALTGDYRKSWTYSTKGNIIYIHSRREYRLTHLLEKGHELPQGGFSNAYPHIKPAEQRAIKELEDRLIKELEQ